MFQNISHDQLIDSWKFGQLIKKSTVHWKVKLWLFDQNQVSKIIFHQDMSKYKYCSSTNQNSRLLWKSQSSKHLEIFPSVKKNMIIS